MPTKQATIEHTVDEALERFTLIRGAGEEDRNEACAMTALSWVAGEAWTDHPQCAHRILSNWVVNANDHPATTVEQRQTLVREGKTGVLDTWWIPSVVLLDCWSKAEGDTRPEKVIDVVKRVAEWKVQPNRQRPDLRDADLRDAVLRGADLSGAVLSGAVLRGAVLRGAVLRDAVLRDADLNGADLNGADLNGAYRPHGVVPAGWTRENNRLVKATV